VFQASGTSARGNDLYTMTVVVENLATSGCGNVMVSCDFSSGLKLDPATLNSNITSDVHTLNSARTIITWEIGNMTGSFVNLTYET